MASSSVGTPQRRGAFTFPDVEVAEGEGATAHISLLREASEPSPMDFAIATQPQDPDPAISEAGASGVTALSNAIAEAVKQRTAAQATIADLNGQLCAARAELAVQHVAQDFAVKFAALEA